MDVPTIGRRLCFFHDTSPNDWLWYHNIQTRIVIALKHTECIDVVVVLSNKIIRVSIYIKR